MEIAEIYARFDQIGCLTFATIDKGYLQTRIAHLFAHDHDGLYFRTMITTGKIRRIELRRREGL